MMLKIQPWPFKRDEEVQLYWLCSPFLDAQKGWLLQVVFKKTDNSICEVTVPWGTIPYLVLGQKYMNGIPIMSGKVGRVYQLTTPDRSSFKLGMAYDIPPALYYFYKNQKYGYQRICKFSIGDINYYIPCLELVRNFLTPHKVLANNIMKPGGLELLFENCSVNGKRLFLALSSEIKGSLISNNTASYLAWLKYDYYANMAWNSIYNNVFSKAVLDNPFKPVEELQKGTYIELMPPVGNGSNWTVRGIGIGKDILILEILSKTNLYMPFNEILYTHPSLTSAEYSDDNRNSRIVRNQYDRDVIDLETTGKGANKTQEEDIVDSISIGFGFDKSPYLEKLRQKNQKTNMGDYSINATTRNFDQYCLTSGVGTTQDWIRGGEVKPLEFTSLEPMEDGATKGLEDFLVVVNYLFEKHVNLEVSINIILIPEGKVFSYYPNRERRNCAIVKITRSGKLPCYIIELGRADDWSISTLLLYQLVADKSPIDIERFIKNLLEELVNNSGHWNKQSLDKEVCYRYDMVKHISGQNLLYWRDRLLAHF